MKKDLIEYDITTAAIEEMKKKYGGMKITDAKSDKAVRTARTLVVSKRTAVEKKRKELKASAIEWGHKVDNEAKRICTLLLPLEEELKAEVKRVDDEIEAKREEKRAKERERIEAIQDKINAIIRTQGIVHNVASSHIEERLIIIKGMKISEDLYQEFTNEAIQAQKEAITALEEALKERLQFEKEEVERKAEAERLEAQRKEQAEAQAKIDEANQKIEEEKAKIEAEKEAEAKHREREEFERQAKERAEAAAAQKLKAAATAEEERVKTAAAEKARQEALRPDKEKLIKFADELYDIECPTVESTKAQKISSEARNKLGELAQDIRAKAKKL